MAAEDGKLRQTDIADTEQLLCLRQSIPSPKAEPFKQWLANFDYERIEESQNPEMSIAGNTRKEIEAKTGKKIISPQNAKQLRLVKKGKALE